MVKCKLCGREFKQISNTHLQKQHNITLPEYQKQFPKAEIVSEEVKNKIKNKNTGKTMSEEHRKNLSDSIKQGFENGRVVHNKGKRGHWKDSPETLEKKRKARTGKKHDEETKKKIGNAHRGKTMSQESIKKMKASLQKSIQENGGGFATGPRSEEFREKMSEIARNRSQEQIEEKVNQMLSARKGQKESEETRELKRQRRLEWMEENKDKIPTFMFDTKPEKEFKEILNEYGINYNFQFHSKNPHFLYDFLIENRIIIEIDGPHHYWERMHPSIEDFENMKLRDAKKNLNAIQKGWAIFRIRVENNLPDDWYQQLEEQGLKIENGEFKLPVSN